MSLYQRLAELPITIETHALEPRSFETPGFTRLTTTVVLQGAGHEGHGEDIAYDDADQEAHRAMTPLPLAGTLPLARVYASFKISGPKGATRRTGYCEFHRDLSPVSRMTCHMYFVNALTWLAWAGDAIRFCISNGSSSRL